MQKLRLVSPGFDTENVSSLTSQNMVDVFALKLKTEISQVYRKIPLLRHVRFQLLHIRQHISMDSTINNATTRSKQIRIRKQILLSDYNDFLLFNGEINSISRSIQNIGRHIGLN